MPRPDSAASGAGDAPLRASGLRLHHDGRWSHEGAPIRNARLRELFDRSVRYLPEARAYALQVGRFRARIEVEEAAFFVRSFEAGSGEIALSDGSCETLEVASLRSSTRDGALLCTVKRGLRPEGVPARFQHAAQAELLNAVQDEPEGPCLRVRHETLQLPAL